MTRRRLLGLVFLVLAVTLLTPPTPSLALLAQVTLADTNNQFQEGAQFLRTGLGNTSPGGIQLLPATTIRPWETNIHPLPQRLLNHAAIGYKNQVFVIGGDGIVNPDTNATAPTKVFYGASLANQETGQLNPWTVYSNQANLALPVALTRTSLAIAETSGGVYLYVIGGLTPAAGDYVSSNTIFYSKLISNTNGIYTPQPWQSIGYDVDLNLPLPQQPSFSPTSRQGAGGGASEIGVAVHSVNGTPRLYLFGGRNRIITSSTGQFGEKYLDSVYSTAINPDGTIQPWSLDPNDNIKTLDVNGTPVRVGNDEGSIGLAGTQAVTSKNVETGKEAVFLLGGRSNPTTSQFSTFNALFNPDGSLTWRRAASLPFPLIYHASITRNGGLYGLGGANSTDENNPQPQNRILAAIVQDDLSISDPGGGLNSFISINNALGKYRQNHAVAGIELGDWVYTMGGRASTTITNTAVITDEVSIGRFGNSSDAQGPVVYVPSGNYYSQPYDFNQATYKKLTWRSIQPAGTSVSMLYRAADTLSALNQTAFVTATGTLVSSSSSVFTYTATLPDGVQGRYFQYIGRLTTSNSSTSPLLDKVDLQLERPGFPNLKPAAQNPIQMPARFPQGSLASVPVITIENKAFDLQTPALDADFGDDGGEFYVDFYAKPTTAGAPNFTESGIAYAKIPKAALKAGTSYAIPANKWFYGPCACPMTLRNWNSIFRQGQYKVYIYVDNVEPTDVHQEFGYVQEAQLTRAGGETDNVSGGLSITVDPPSVFLPFAWR